MGGASTSGLVRGLEGGGSGGGGGRARHFPRELRGGRSLQAPAPRGVRIPGAGRMRVNICTYIYTHIHARCGVGACPRPDSGCRPRGSSGCGRAPRGPRLAHSLAGCSCASGAGSYIKSVRRFHAAAAGCCVPYNYMHVDAAAAGHVLRACAAGRFRGNSRVQCGSCHVMCLHAWRRAGSSLSLGPPSALHATWRQHHGPDVGSGSASGRGRGGDGDEAPSRLCRGGGGRRAAGRSRPG